MQIIVYAGAIVVLFLFVIMLLGVDREESLAGPDPVPAAGRDRRSGSILLGEILVLAGRTWATGAPSVRRLGARAVDGQAATSSASRGVCSPTSCGRSRSPPSCS